MILNVELGHFFKSLHYEISTFCSYAALGFELKNQRTRARAYKWEERSLAHRAFLLDCWHALIIHQKCSQRNFVLNFKQLYVLTVLERRIH